MTSTRIHYHPDTGRIIAWDNSPSGDPLRGGKIVTLDGIIQIDPKVQCINLETFELVEMSAQDQRAINAPQDWEIRALRSAELSGTDSLMAPDRTVPDREAWTTYRRALRDLPNGAATVQQMVTNFPVRPDGKDAAAALRERI